MSQWQRLSPISIILFIVTVIRINWAMIPIFFVSFKDIDFSSSTFFMIVIGVSFIVVFSAFLRYKFFMYRLVDNELQIKSGIISKKLKTISFDRIQSLNTKQNIIFRLFKIVQVNIDTAGSSVQEVQLPGISSELFLSIKELIYSKKNKQSSINEEEVKKVTKSLLRYHFKEFFKIGVSSNKFFIALAGLWATYNAISENIQDMLGLSLDQKVYEYAEHIDTSDTVIFVFSLILIGLFIFLFFSVGGAVLSYFNFRFVHENDAFRKKAGLFSKKEEVLALHKIQSVRFKQNFVQRLLNHYEIILKQASSVIDVSENTTFIIPFAEKSFNTKFLANYFHFSNDAGDCERVSSKYIWKYWSLFFLYPSLICVVSLYFVLEWQSFYFFFWGIFGYWMIRMVYSKCGYFFSESVLKIQKGFLGRTLVYVEPYKIQNLVISQSPYQRRNKLGSLIIYTAAETLTIPFLEEEVLHDIFDKITQTVNNTQKKWF